MALYWVDDEHPTNEQIAAWVDYGLPAPERETVDAHLLDCPYCFRLAELVREANEYYERIRERPSTPHTVYLVRVLHALRLL